MYGVSGLVCLALAGVLNCVERIQAEYRISDDITDVFQLFKLLTKYKDQDPQFGTMTADMTKKHLKEFWAIAELRKVVAEEDSKELIGVIVGEIDHTLVRQPAISVTQGEGDRQFAQCPSCQVIWATAGALGYRCPKCHGDPVGRECLSRWRRV
jgi:hypothetical protein